MQLYVAQATAMDFCIPGGPPDVRYEALYVVKAKMVTSPSPPLQLCIPVALRM